MAENEISGIVRMILLDIHMKYGPGLYESVYERVLLARLKEHGFSAKSQVPIYLDEPGLENELAFRIDILIEDKVILELKSVKAIHPLHRAQLQTYLKLTGLKLGLLINFNVHRILYGGIERIVNGLEEGLDDPIK